MKRRDLILCFAGAAIAWPVRLSAQKSAPDTKRVVRIGALIEPTRRKSFEQGLRELGLVDGGNITIVYKPIDDETRLAAMVAELLALKVDVIVTEGAAAAQAAQAASRTVPIVMAAANDPVGSGLVDSLARPGGNTTGFSLTNPELSGKRLELLKRLVPDLERVAVLMQSDDAPSLASWRETEQSARQLGLTVQAADVQSFDGFAAALSGIENFQSQALIVLPAPLIIARMRSIAEWALGHRLPSIYPFRIFPDVGGLMSCGPSVDDLVRLAASYVDEIIKGANPAELPVQPPTVVEIVINLKTAKALRLEIPSELVATADDVIE